MKQKQIKALLAIKTPQDIKQFEVVREFYDDKEECVEVKINGIKVEFMWKKDINFVYKWQNCDKSFKKMRNAVAMACEYMQL